MDKLNYWLAEICGYLRSVFAVVFPEYPSIGVWLAGFALLIFVYYLIRAGFGRAVKVALVSFFGGSLVLFVLHHLNKLFHVF